MIAKLNVLSTDTMDTLDNNIVIYNQSEPLE